MRPYQRGELAEGGGRPTSVLVITSNPDQRESTSSLREIVDELRRRPDVRVEVWFLRAYEPAVPWEGARVADSLRTWGPARALDLVGAGRVADALRGLRLRAWIRRADPDGIILGDGVGDRLIEHAPRRPVRIERTNPSPPDFADMEPPPVAPADLHIVSGNPLSPHDATRLVEPVYPFIICEDGKDFGDTPTREQQLSELGLPADAVVIVGWGADGWLDGPDLFIRSLWFLEQRHGIVAHGVWAGSGSDAHEVDRLRAEAARCGVEDRFHYLTRLTRGVKLCGDAVFLPYRSSPERDGLLPVITSGGAVVTFPVIDPDYPAVHVVPHLDVEAAAAAIAVAVSEDRDVRQYESLREIDLVTFADDLIDAIRSTHR